MKSWHSLIILAILNLLFFWPCWLQGLPIMQGDNLDNNYSLRIMSYDLLKQGVFPFWNPYTHLGIPLFAGIQEGILFPLNWILLFFPNELGFNLQITLTYFLSSLGIFLYCRELTKNNFASLFAGITFAYSSYMLFKIEYVSMIQAISLIPFILLFLEKANNKLFNTNVLLACLFIGLQHLAGHPQISFFTVILIGLHQLYKFIDNFNQQGKAYYLINGLFVVIIGTLLAAVQLLPTWELLTESIRSKLTYDEFAFGSLFPMGVLTLIFPYVLGSPHGNDLYFPGVFNEVSYCIYTGILPLLFSKIALRNMKEHSIILFWLIVAIIGLILSLGSFLPFHKIFYYLPLFNSFRYPLRFCLFLTLAISVLSSFGIVGLVNLTKSQLIKEVDQCAKLTIVLVTITLFFVIIINRSEGLRYLPYLSVNIIYPIIIILLSFASLIILYLKSNVYSKSVLIIILTIDLMIIFGQFTGWRNDSIAEYKYIKSTPKVAQFLKDNLSPFERYIVYEFYLKQDKGNLLRPTYNVLYKLHCANGFSPFTINRYIQVFQILMEGKFLTKKSLKFNANSRIYDICGIKYFVCPKEFFTKPYETLLKSPRWKEVFCYKDVCVFENKHYLPKAWVVKDYLTFNDYSDAIQYIKNNDINWNPQRLALVEKKFARKLTVTPNNLDANYSIKFKKYTTNEIIFEVMTKTKGILIQGDGYYPTWKAYVDNKKTEIFPVDAALRGIELPEGNHIIKFVIEDNYFILGLILSSFTLLCLVYLYIKVNKIANQLDNK